jgi:hypothetical protein
VNIFESIAAQLNGHNQPKPEPTLADLIQDMFTNPAKYGAPDMRKTQHGRSTQISADKVQRDS